MKNNVEHIHKILQGRKKVLGVSDSETNSFFDPFLNSLPTKQIDLKTCLISLRKPDTEEYVLVIKSKSIDEKYTNWIWPISGMNRTCLYITDFILEVNEKKDFKASAKAFLPAYDARKFLEVDVSFKNDDLSPYWEISKINNAAEISFLNYLKVGRVYKDSFLSFPPKLLNLIKNNIENIDFRIKFYPNRALNYYYYLGVNVKKAWEIIPNKIELNNFKIAASLSSDFSEVQVEGTIDIEEKTVVVLTRISTDSILSVSINTKAAELSISSLATHFDSGKVNLPEDIKPADIVLNQVNLDYDFKTSKIRKLNVWSEIKLKKLVFNVHLQLIPYLKIQGSLDTKTKNITVKKVLSSFKLPTFNVGEKTVISEAYLEAYPKESYYKIRFGLKDVATFSLTEKIKIDIKNIEIQAVKSHSTYTGYIYAKLELPSPKKDELPPRFELMAEKSTNNWYFSGDLTGDIALTPLTDWIEEKKFLGKENKLPAWVKNLHLTHAEIGFSTAGDFNFDIALYALLNKEDEDEKKLNIQIHIDKKEKKEPELSASVGFENHLFTGKIDENGLALNWNGGESSIKLSDITNELGLSKHIKIPEALDLAFNNANLVYSSIGKGKDGKKALIITAGKKGEYNLSFIATKVDKEWVYAFIVDITKINITLSGIPLVGKDLPKGMGVEKVQLLLLSKELKKKEITSINKDLGDGTKLKLPVQKEEGEKLLKGAYLNMELNLGVIQYPISLSTASKQKEKPKLRSVMARASSVGNSVAEQPAAVTWKKIGKKVGPLTLNKIGFSYAESKLNLFFDAAISAGPLKLGLDELQLSSPVKEFNPTASLNGLSLEYNTPIVKIGGSFKKLSKNSYAGSALIGVKAFQLAAMGAYSQVEGETSLFVYAMQTNPALGGPPEFYVTGLAGGFGYNRNLKLPNVDEVKAFPFVSPLISNAAVKTDVTKALKELIDKKVIEPQVGQQWLALGIRFTTYKILETFALLAVKFGTKTEIGLIGFSSISFPGVKGQPTLVNAELALAARISPEEGVATVAAKLTAESYILTKECKLTGGFAYYTWFGNHKHSGDFVLTMGGYPLKGYAKPAHYPVVPRLGFQLDIDKTLKLKGGLYFALTPSCIMFGGRFEANFKSGPFEAWFVMNADFKLAWAPYAYTANIAIAFGVSYTFKADLWVGTVTKKITVRRSAQLQLWGPEFAGRAVVDLSVVSFAFKFGEPSTGQKTVSWEDFKTSFLPKVIDSEKKSSTNGVQLTDSYCTAKASSGVKAAETKTGDPIQLYQENVAFQVNSLIPIQTSKVLGEKIEVKNTKFGVKTVGISSDIFKPELEVKITKDDEGALLASGFTVKPILSNVPSAMWGDGGKKYSEKESMIKGVLTGVTIIPKAKPLGEPVTVDFTKGAEKKKGKEINFSPIGRPYKKVKIEDKEQASFKEFAWL